MSIHSVIIDDVRCFGGRRDVELRPITILVGGNSTGKSTFLALVRIAWDVCNGDLSSDIFNEEPFSLGAFDNIATYRGGQKRARSSFQIGVRVRIPASVRSDASVPLDDYATITAEFVRQGAQPRLGKWTWDIGPYGMEIEYGDDANQMTVRGPSGIDRQTDDSLRKLRVKGMSQIGGLMALLVFSERRAGEDKPSGATISSKDADFIGAASISIASEVGQRPYAFAPIRTKPSRTYNPMKEVQQAEGGHVPMVLARVREVDPKHWKALKDALVRFGTEAGLFTKIEVRRKGNKASDPFQIEVRAGKSGAGFNMVDVGYGVSQGLPILVDCLEGPLGATFLLQQPEVHMHPRAQAEIGSFLATLWKVQNKRFVVETHSDYILDRLRGEMRSNSELGARDVAVLYFQADGKGAKVSEVKLDDDGNIEKAPRGYRAFFLEEEKRMLGG